NCECSIKLHSHLIGILENWFLKVSTSEGRFCQYPYLRQNQLLYPLNTEFDQSYEAVKTHWQSHESQKLIGLLVDTFASIAAWSIFHQPIKKGLVEVTFNFNNHHDHG